MNLEELLVAGQTRLEEERITKALAEEAARQEQKRKELAYAQDIRQGVQELLPEALWPFLAATDLYIGQHTTEIAIRVPGCAPVYCHYMVKPRRFDNSQAPFRVPSVREGGISDYDDLYEPEYMLTRHDYCTDDVGKALAVAKERRAEMRKAELAFELLKNMRAAEPVTEIPLPEPPPSPDHRFADLVRRIVREELANA